jgi:OmcA/MtrC family decaheme c-type cytochrome
VFSVFNPELKTYWNISKDLPYQTSGSSLTIDIGWDAREFGNTGSAGTAMASVASAPLGTSAAMPVRITNVHRAGPNEAKPCNSALECPGLTEITGRFWVERVVTPVQFKQAVAFGRVGIEGRAVCVGWADCPAVTPAVNIPVRSVVADFAFVASATPVAAMVDDQRRKLVDLDTKCAKCHNGTRLSSAGTPIPRLSLHGGQRNENLNLCVVCHNPNQTDVAFRTAGKEASIDFKRMVHAIHAGGFRTTPYVVIGFNGSVHDYSGVRFPARLRDCTNCHLDDGRKGSFELPLQSSGIPQHNIGTTVVERCVSCHGPGKDKDVRRAHEIGGGSSSSDERDDD